MKQDTTLKITRAREQILTLLREANCPVCYEDIKERISMDKATFYRNIITFEAHGMIRSFESNNKKRYYELYQTPHAHFFCTQCDRIQCIQEDLHIQLENYQIEDVMLKGICPHCQELQTGESPSESLR